MYIYLSRETNFIVIQFRYFILRGYKIRDLKFLDRIKL